MKFKMERETQTNKCPVTLNLAATKVQIGKGVFHKSINSFNKKNIVMSQHELVMKHWKEEN